EWIGKSMGGVGLGGVGMRGVGFQSVEMDSTRVLARTVEEIVREVDGSGGQWPLPVARKLTELALRCAVRQREARPNLVEVVQPAMGEVMEEAEGEMGKRRRSFDEQCMCPLSQKRMTDPVVAADGFTYERSSIERWLLTNSVSPRTGQPLSHKHLTPNHTLKLLLHSH
ncbi:unnamed protein product, partial [Closterium sp. NIES-54]